LLYSEGNLFGFWIFFDEMNSKKVQKAEGIPEDNRKNFTTQPS